MTKRFIKATDMNTSTFYINVRYIVTIEKHFFSRENIEFYTITYYKNNDLVEATISEDDYIELVAEIGGN